MFSRCTIGLVILSLAFSISGARAQEYVYGVGSFPAGQVANKMIAADFNSDGATDIAVLGVTAAPAIGVSILLGKANGSLSPAVGYSLPASIIPTSLATGDFNGDGKLDLVVTGYVLLGNGDGTFQSAISYAGPNSTSLTDVTVADFNKDGKMDLAVTGANFGTRQLAIFLGNGDGTFQAPTSFDAGSGNPNSIVAGDLNGDGIPDVVLGSGFSTPDGVITVFLGVGDGTFQSPVAYAVPGSGGISLALADMNADGRLDAVAGTFSSATGGVAVLLNQGNGVLGAATVYSPSLLFIVSIAVADFNADGKPDVAVTGGLLDTVEVLLGNTNGTLDNSVAYGMALRSHGIVAADFNHDGRLDLAANENFAADAAVTILIGQGNGTFGNQSQFPGPPYPYEMAVADFNGDGHTDAVISSFQNAGQISVLLGQGAGIFQAPMNRAVGHYPTHLGAGDFNPDGKIDVVFTDIDPLTNNPRLGTLLGNGDGTFAPLVSRTVSFIQNKFARADFNRDGKLDVAAADILSGTVNVYLGQGDGSFGNPTTYPTFPNPQDVYAADFNGDGSTDLAVAVQNGGISILMNNGNGTFQPHQDLSPQIFLGAVTDIDNDGKQDLLTGGFANTLTVLFGNGNGTFRAGTPQTLVNGWGASVQVGDYNGDGKKDLAFLTNNMAILLGNGDGTFGERIDYLTPNSPSSLATGDFGTGGADMIVGTASIGANGTFAVYLSAPIISIFPNHISFTSAQFIGTSSASQTVTLTNAGSTALGLSNFAISADFTQQNACNSPLQPGHNCTILLSVTPTTTGPVTGTLTFQHTAAGGTQAISLSGAGKGFRLGSSQTSVTITAGQTATYAVNITPEGGSADTVSLTCTGAPARATCSVTPNSVTLDGTHPASVAVNVTTQAASAVSSVASEPSRPIPSVRGVLVAVIAVAWIAIVISSKSGSRNTRLATLALCTLLLGASSCGGGSTSPGPGTRTQTPPGTYVLKIQGQATSGAATYSSNVSLTLVVQ